MNRVIKAAIVSVLTAGLALAGATASQGAEGSPVVVGGIGCCKV